MAIKDICRRYSQSHLKTELIDGVVSRQKVLSAPYPQKPNVGSSIGVTGVDWASSSLGGYLELVQEDGQVLKCALSCHHVLRPTKQPQSSDLTPSESTEPEGASAKLAGKLMAS